MSVKEHYNRVAREPPVMCMGLRSAHRQAKRAMIEMSVQLVCGHISSAHILDVACGRGGDMVKCQGCASYVGVDCADQALAELQRRASEIGMDVTTYCTDAADLPAIQQRNVAMCNFALHYFCDTEAHLARLMRKVADCLVPDGVFCGTYQRWQGSSIAWGTAHHAVVGDCVDAVEYKVPWHKVARHALKCGLALVSHAPLQYLHGNADHTIWFFIMRLSSRPQPRCDT